MPASLSLGPPGPLLALDPRRIWRRETANAGAFVGLWLFTLVLYLRPNDLLPIGTFPVAKIVGASALAIFAAEQMSAGRLTVTPPELKYFLALMGFMLLSVPAALDPGRALEVLTEGIFKVFSIFMLIINVVSSWRRIRKLVGLVVGCGAIIAVGTIWQASDIKIDEYRVSGFVRGMFGNPNDLALALNMLIPLAIGLALTSGGLKRLLYVSGAAVMTGAMFLTYSRGGFLTFLAMGGFLAFKATRNSVGTRVIGIVLGVVGLLTFAPEGFGLRMLSIFDHSLDLTGSAEARTALFWRSLDVIAPNPKVWLVGVGLDNFHIVSIGEAVNHNAYSQVLTEVGLPALVFYLLFIYGAFTGTRWVEQCALRNRQLWPVAVLAVSIQASLIAYLVGSFFASVAYLWYLYYAAGFGIALRIAVERALAGPER